MIFLFIIWETKVCGSRKRNIAIAYFDEFDNVVDDDESKQLLKDGPFGEALKAAQVALYASIFI